MSEFRPPRSQPAGPRRRRSAPPSAHPSKLRPGAVGADRWVYGKHAVAAALANPERRWRRLVVLAGHEQQAAALIAGARARRRGEAEALLIVDHDGFAPILPESAVHQGLALEVEPLPERHLDDVLRRTGELAARPFVVLDRISDPQNIGAVLRSAAAFGAFAVVVPARGAPVVTGALAKAASGAVEIVPLVRVVNIARALDRLKQAGFWICGLDESAPQRLAELELGRRVALVLGSEGAGMRRLVRERCDFLARLPTRPEQPTLNASNAAAIALYELVRHSSDE